MANSALPSRFHFMPVPGRARNRSAHVRRVVRDATGPALCLRNERAGRRWRGSADAAQRRVPAEKENGAGWNGDQIDTCG